MKKLLAICLLLVLPAAAVEGDQVMYMGGTAPGFHSGAIGQLDTTSQTTLVFDSSGTKLLIPYDGIESFDYSREVTRHLGVMPAIAVGIMRVRKHRHYFRISYHTSDYVAQVAVFEVPKHMPRTLEAVLKTRSPQAHNQCSPCAGGN